MSEVLAVDPPKPCLVLGLDTEWHPGMLTHWWWNAAKGRWEGMVVAPSATGQTAGVWLAADALRPR